MHECLSLLKDVSAKEIDKMIALADEDGSGNIDFEEFVEACVHKNMLT
jgi:Ca2+-binding EF-hand superfamily protein